MFCHLQRPVFLFFACYILLLECISPIQAQPGSEQIPNLLGLWQAEGDGRDTLGYSDGYLNGRMNCLNGKFGKAFGFDGIDDYVTVPFNQRLKINPYSEFTLSVWVSPKLQDKLQTLVSLFVTHSTQSATVSTQDQFDWGIYLDSSNRFVVTDAVNYLTSHTPLPKNSEIEANLLVSKTVAQLNDWYFVSLVYRDQNWQLYVNGQLEAVRSSDFTVRSAHTSVPSNRSSRSTPSGGRLTFGRNIHGSGQNLNYFRGMIDEVKLYNRALTSEEVISEYSGIRHIPQPTFEMNLAWKKISTDPENAIRFTEVPMATHAMVSSRAIISPDGNSLINLDLAGIDLWDIKTAHRRAAFKHSSERKRYYTADFSFDSQTMAVGCTDGSIALVDVQSGLILSETRVTEHSIAPITCSFKDDILAFGDSTGNLGIWNYKTQKLSFFRKVGWGYLGHFRFTPDGNILVITGNDGVVQLRSTETGHLLKELKPQETISSTTISPDGKTLAGIGKSGTIWFWELPTGNLKGIWKSSIEIRSPSSPALTYALNGTILAAGDSDGFQGEMVLLDVQTGKKLGRQAMPVNRILSISRKGDLIVTHGMKQATSNMAMSHCFLWNLLPPGTTSPFTEERRLALLRPTAIFPRMPPTNHNPLLPPRPLPTILFHSNRDGNDEIYAMSGDGTTVRRLTNNPANDGGVVVKADGTQVAFTSNRDGNLEIYRINSDGSEETRLTDHPANDIVSSWNRDGRLAFYSNRDGNYNIYTMNEEGDTLVKLTDDRADDIHPAFSPDGRRIAFASNRSGVYEIYVMAANGNDVVRLTSSPLSNREPAWSPDGKKIVWTRREGENNENIYIMNADGTGQTCLTDYNGKDVRPTFSADGKKIIFASDRDGNMNIYSMEINGSNVARLTSSLANNLDPYAGRIQAVTP